MQKGKYFETLIQKHILSNPNYCCMAMVPNEKYFSSITEQEQTHL